LGFAELFTFELGAGRGRADGVQYIMRPSGRRAAYIKHACVWNIHTSS